MQWPDRQALGAFGIARAGLAKGMLFVQELPSLHQRLGLADARQAGLHQLLGTERALGDGAGGGGAAQLVPARRGP